MCADMYVCSMCADMYVGTMCADMYVCSMCADMYACIPHQREYAEAFVYLWTGKVNVCMCLFVYMYMNVFTCTQISAQYGVCMYARMNIRTKNKTQPI